MKRMVITASRRNSKVVAAEGQSKGQEAFDESIANLDANFDYLVDGLEKLSRDGGEGQSQALQLVLEANTAIEGIIQKIASAITQ